MPRSRLQLPKFRSIQFPKLFANTTIRNKIFGTLFVIVIYRLLLAIPLPGINVTQFQETFGGLSTSDTSYVFNLFTGGSFDSPSIVGMGIAAYINASIIIQLLGSIVPALERLSKEGQRGRDVLNRYTRYLTVPLASFYALGYIIFLRTVDTQTDIGQSLVQSGIRAIFEGLTGRQVLLIVVSLTAGTMLLMWLAELLTEVGIGNGMSIFISMNIATTLPALLNRDFTTLNIQSAFTSFFQEGDVSMLGSDAFVYIYLLIFGALLIFAAIVFITESTRKLPIQYARRVRGSEVGEKSFLPLKLNQAGVIPVIFASSILTMPRLLFPILANAGANMEDGAFAKDFLVGLNDSFLLNSTTSGYIVIYLLLILAFSFFYSFVVMKPETVAENLQKSGGFIPGIRPGKSTSQYITRVMLRLTLVGGIFLAVVAVLPVIVGNALQTDTGSQLALFSGIGGTSLIIIVGTALETYRQYKSLRLSQSYEQYL